MQNIVKLFIFIFLHIQFALFCKASPENFLTGKPNDQVDFKLVRRFLKNVSNDSIIVKRFQKWTTNNANITFQDWFILRTQDGALCRDDRDCNWIQEDLVCHYASLKTYVSILSLISKVICELHNIVQYRMLVCN